MAYLISIAVIETITNLSGPNTYLPCMPTNFILPCKPVVKMNSAGQLNPITAVYTAVTNTCFSRLDMINFRPT